MSENKISNRLAQEKSPYLLQHAHNPVDWYPWGEEAFTKAKEEDKPVFLSIGYSTCHWCHVMEKESFEDEEVAEVLNKHFISIKVDREERPDIDQIYMSVCQAMTGQGGWPLTVIMTGEKKPFFAGTYFPKQSKWGRPGLIELLLAVEEQWTKNRELIKESSEKITAALQGQEQTGIQQALEEKTAELAYQQLAEEFDPDYGGFGTAPKFPTPHNLMFLLRYWKRTGQQKALQIVEKTLESMAQGGIYDHLGYGFARYSVDEKWLIPHFEKMLYDNALLAYTYLEAYQCTQKEEYAKIARQILTYIDRDMTDPEGGFYSAEDADSEGEEGKFYAWQQDEIMDLLGPSDGRVFCSFYNVSGGGNFEHGTNVLNRIGQDLNHFALQIDRLPEEVAGILESSRRLLWQEREKRIHPYKDDKILTAWNGLMIAACAKAYAVLEDNLYGEMAEKAVAFIYEKLVREDGRLLARYREGEAAYPAYLDDYAFLLWGLIELYEATLKVVYLDKALNLAQEIDRLFRDEDGGYYFSGSDAEELLVRPKEVYDGATPSGNSVAALSFLKLRALTNQEKWQDRALEMLQVFGGAVRRFPQGYTYLLSALEWTLVPPSQLVLVGRLEQENLIKMMNLAQKPFQPGRVLLWHDLDNTEEIKKVLPKITDYTPVQDQVTAYLCENYACQPPVTKVEDWQF